MKTYCTICGEPTTKPYYKLCLDCWHEQNSKNSDVLVLRDQIQKLETELSKCRLENLRYQLNSPKFQRTALPPDLKKKLRQLCHPDKHNGSALATSVFKELENL